jgi:hypothetical protein
VWCQGWSRRLSPPSRPAGVGLVRELVELVLEVADLLPERDHFAYTRQGDAFVGEPHDLAEPLDLVPAVAALTTAGESRCSTTWQATSSATIPVHRRCPTFELRTSSGRLSRSSASAQKPSDGIQKRSWNCV